MEMKFTHSWLNAILFCFLASTILPSTWAADLPVNWTELPKPFHTPSAHNPPRVVAKPEGAQLQVPAGFTVEEYLSGFSGPRFMLLGPGNEIVVSDMDNGTVYVLKDKNKQVLMEDLDQPYGLAFHKDWLYIAEATAVKRYRYDPKALKIVEKGQEVIPLHKFGGGHATRTILFDPKGEKLYLSVGSGSNVDSGEPLMRAAISRFDPSGSNHEIYASGVRNAIGIRWYPGTETLWVTVQERDGLGDDLVPDYLTRIQAGGFYGRPYAYIGPHPDPRRKDAPEGIVSKTLYPDVLLGSHVSAMDLLFYTGAQFPERYRGGCFIAMHGSWNRSKRIGYKIAFVPFKEGKPVSGPEDFLTGWMLDPEKREVWGKPVGLLQLADGSLLVSDDGGGKIWRVFYKG
jgi:glucose/arabinose dehydrogenase